MPEITPTALPLSLFDHNWHDAVNLNTAWSTDIVRPMSVDEQRRGQASKPFRTLKISGVTFVAGDPGIFKTMARRATGGRFYVPVFCDGTAVLEDLGANTFSCDTTNRRLFVGFKAMIVEFDFYGRASRFAVSEIAALTDTTVEFTDAIFSPINSNAKIYPVIEADVTLSQNGKALTDFHLQFDITCKEVVGNTALPAVLAADDDPPGETLYNLIPVLSIPHNWENAEEGEFREATVTDVGLDNVTTIYGAGRVTGTLEFLSLSRETAFRVLRFWDSRCGSLFHFWLPSQTADLVIVSKTSNTVWKVRKTIDSADIIGRGYVAFWELDTVTIRKVVSCVTSGSDWAITLDAAITAAASAISRLGFASLARFDTDEMQEEWSTDGTMTTRLTLRGVQPCSTGYGEVGDCGEEFPTVPDPRTDQPAEPPWEPYECGSVAVTVPMYFDSTQALGSRSEPIRAADLNMPTSLQVWLKPHWHQDPNHPYTAPMSSELILALRRTHELIYQGVSPLVTSRNPYHMRLGGTLGEPSFTYSLGAGDPGLGVVRHIWQKIINYKDDDGNDQTLDIRFGAEYVADQTDPESAKGLWGTLFWKAYYTSEISDYVDGTPVPEMDDVGSYSRDDALISGSVYADDLDSKFYHPALIAYSVCATSMHGPKGHAWVPPDRERWRVCYDQPAGAFWLADDYSNALWNSVFGKEGGGYNTAGMTLGIDIGSSTSQFFPWMCAENGGDQGRTLLSPDHPGWSESTAQLTVADGNDISIHVCNPGQLGNAINHCHGHPDDRIGGIGGTHACFRNAGGTNYICTGISGTAHIDIIEMCVKETLIYDRDCVITDHQCSAEGTLTPFPLVVLWDYTYNFGGTASTRSLEFRQYVEDPTYVRGSWTFEDTDFTGWGQNVGVWDFDTTFTVITIDTGGDIKAEAQYTPYIGHLYEDGGIQVISRATDATIGFKLRWHPGMSGNNGYWLEFDRVDLKARIFKVLNDVKTLLAEVSHDMDISLDAKLAVNVDGARITMTWRDPTEPSTHQGDVHIDDCDYDVGGTMTLMVLETEDPGQVFDEVSVYDNNWRKVYASIIVNGTDFISTDVDPKACNMYGECDLVIGAGCGDPGTCPCETISYAQQARRAANAAGTDVAGPDGGNPGAEDCEDDGCDGCPAPWVGVKATLPPGCEDPDELSTSEFHDGIAGWVIHRLSTPDP